MENEELKTTNLGISVDINRGVVYKFTRTLINSSKQVIELNT